MLEKFLSQLGASTRITVGVSVSPNVGLEMIEVDKPSGIVNKYSFRPLEYNSSKRDIADYNQFRIALEELFEELNIPKRSNIVLSLPNVYFGIIKLPTLLTDEAITNAIISEVEQSYVFKRQEPVVSWSDVSLNFESESRTLAYTAVQKQALEEILEVCDEIGCSLVCVENSYTSLLRSLYYLNSTKEQMKENVPWNLMVIMQNNYSILSMSGKKVVEYFEEPLALKSFIDDEIYNAIKTSAQLTLAGLPANYLFLVSETDLVSAEVLSMKMPFDGSVSFLESNKFIQNELMPISLNILPNKSSQITPEAIGTAVYPFCDFSLKLNAIKTKNGESGLIDDDEDYPRINVGNLEVELTPNFVRKIILILASTTIIPVLILLLFLTKFIIPKEQGRLGEIKSQIESLNTEIKKFEDNNKNNFFDVYAQVKNVVSKNKLKLSYYSALGISIPNKLWVTYYESNQNGEINIQGTSNDVKSVYTFYKNIKQMVNNSNIKLKKLEITSNSMDAVIENSSNVNKKYDFEISNMNSSGSSQSQQNPSDSNSKNPDNKQNLFQFGNFFSGIKEGEQQNSSSSNEQLPENLKKIEKF